MAVSPIHKNVHLVEPGGTAPTSAILEELSKAPNSPDELDNSQELEDGSLLLSYGKPKAKIGGKDDKFDRNLAEDMDDSALNALAARLLSEIENDELSRREWEETANLTASYLGIKLEDPKASVSADGTVCQSVATCMLEAAIKLWGVGRAELLPVSGPVKVRKDHPPAPSDEEEQEGAASEASPGIGHNGGPPMAGAPPAAQPPVDHPGGIAATAAGVPPAQGIAQPPPPGQPPQPPKKSLPPGDRLATALEMDMNHYLTVVDRPYYADFSRMLMHRYLIGVAFRKVYRDPLLRRPVSRWVKAQNFIINNEVTHLDERGRRTERIPTSQSTMRRLMAAGHYRDIPLQHPTHRPSDTELAVAEVEGIAATSALPEDYPHTVYECYCEIGSGTGNSLFGDIAELERDETGKKPGYPLPYRVSIDFDSRAILEIRRNWKKGDKDHEPRRHYVKYGMIPGLGYYDLGLIHIVGNPTQAATMIQRAMVDTSLFSNFPGGVFLKGPGSRQANTVVRPGPGEFVGMDAAGAQKIQDVLMPLPYKPPTPEIMALVEKMESDVRRLSGVVEIPVGEGRLGNTPVGTIMSYVESVSQVPGAVHKEDHRAQADEFAILRELFAEDPSALVRGVKRPARQWQIADEIMEPELVPAADPNTPSEMHRLLKIQAAVTLAAQPQFQGIFNQRTIGEWAMEAISEENVSDFMMPLQAPPPPPPDPKLQVAQIRAQSDREKLQVQQQTEQQKHAERMQELATEDQQREADRQSAETRAAMSLEAARVKATHEANTAAMETHHDSANAAADRAQRDQHKAADIQHQQSTAAMQQADNEANRAQADTHKAADVAQAATAAPPPDKTGGE